MTRLLFTHLHSVLSTWLSPKAIKTTQAGTYVNYKLGTSSRFNLHQVADTILKGRQLEFFNWDGDKQESLKEVRDKLNRLGEVGT